MSKAKFAAAKELITERKYDEARRILKTIDHPTAREWEAKLDQLDQFVVPTEAQIKPSKKKSTPAPKTGNHKIYNGMRGCLVVFVVLIGIVIFTTPPKNPTATSRPDVRPTATEVQSNAIVPTNAISRSGFVTITPASGTTYLTATITDTPILLPTATDTPTSTTLPTETPVLQITPVSNNLYDVISTANARSCPDSKCDLIGQFQSGNIISVLGIVTGENYKNSPLWIQAIYHDGQTVYVHSSLVTPHPDYVQPTQAAAPVAQQPQSPANNAMIPENCSTAVAMGLSAQQAAQYPGLDRNHNGVACYGS
jgi:hypothetical protein